MPITLSRFYLGIADISRHRVYMIRKDKRLMFNFGVVLGAYRRVYPVDPRECIRTRLAGKNTFFRISQSPCVMQLQVSKESGQTNLGSTGILL